MSWSEFRRLFVTLDMLTARKGDDLVKGMRRLDVQASQDWGIVVTQTHIGPENLARFLPAMAL